MIFANGALSGSYDYGEVARSGLTGIATSHAALDLAGRVTAARGGAQLSWLSGGGTAMGMGIRAIHFEGMLTFHLPVPVDYYWPTVMASLLVAILASAVALYVASRQKMGKRAEAELRESEARFRLVADSAPVMIWMSGTDKLCTYFNKPWLDFTGRSIDRELGNGWADGVDPDDLQRCLDTYVQAFDRREVFRMEYRLRQHDGEFRWLLDIGVPRFNSDGSF